MRSPQQREWALRSSRDERNIRRLLRSTLGPYSNCVDVGANVGDFLRLIIEFAPHGRHIAVEPLPAFAEALAASYPDVLVEACALAESPGTTEFFYVPDRPAWSGMRSQEYPEAIKAETISVEVKSLDTLVTTDVSFVKIDVEGAEFTVLDGATRLLTESRPVVLFEHAPIHAREYGVTATAIHDLLSSFAYGVWSLDGAGPHTGAELSALCAQAHASNYGRSAETNWIARPLQA